MKTAALVVLGCLLSSCSSRHEGISVEAHGYGDKKPIRKIHVEYSGAQAANDRFSKVLSLAFMDYGLEVEPDRAKAEGLVTVRAEEKTGPKTIYAQMLKVKVSTRDGTAHMIDACQFTSEQAIAVTDSWSYPHRVYLVNELKPIVSEPSAVYIGPLQGDEDSVLSEAIKAELRNGRYKLASNKSEADAVVEEAKPHIGEIPIVALQQRIFLEATVDGWTGYSFTSDASRNVYQPPAQPLPEAVQPCSSSVPLYTRNDSRDATWDVAVQLAQSLARRK
jgi:hypothetical protein